MPSLFSQRYPCSWREFGEIGPARTTCVISAYGFRPPSLYSDRPHNADARVAERRDGGSYPVGKGVLT